MIGVGTLIALAGLAERAASQRGQRFLTCDYH